MSRCIHGMIVGTCAVCPAAEVERPRVRGFHPACLALPVPTAEEVARMAEDLRRHGLREPIVITDEGMVLDGRLRLLGAEEAGVPLRLRVVHLASEAEAAELVASLHLARRHMSNSQRAMVAERLAFLVGGRGHTPGARPLSKEKAGAALGVGRESVDVARKVRNADPELAARVERGELSVSAAVRELRERRVSVRRPATLSALAAEIMRLDGEHSGLIERSVALRLLAIEAARLSGEAVAA